MSSVCGVNKRGCRKLFGMHLEGRVNWKDIEEGRSDLSSFVPNLNNFLGFTFFTIQ